MRISRLLFVFINTILSNASTKPSSAGSESRIFSKDPWYITSSHYWSFNKMDSNKQILDATGYRKSKVYGGADITPGANKNSLQLDGLLSTGANLGNFSKTCLSEPLHCKNGFSVAFWIKLNTLEIKDDPFQVIFQVSRMKQSVGTTLYAKKGIVGVAVNDRNTSRTVEISWNTTDWTHLTLIWNKLQDKVDIYLNCRESKAIKKSKVKNNFFLVPPQNQMWLGSNYALMKNCKLAIDELAIWYLVLSPEEICYLHKVKAVDGGFTSWSNFTSCSATCGLGTKTRMRSCTNPVPQHGGSQCMGAHNETLTCFLRECPIDGNYTMWSAFSVCSKTCGGGERQRYRMCTRPVPMYDGMNCSRYGKSKQVVSCNTKPCPIDGGLTQWSNFTTCSVSCGDGKRARYRTCTNPPPQYGGKNCSKYDKTIDTAYCNLKVCPVDGNYSNWSPYISCSRTCGGGSQSRTRQCNNPVPVGDGRNCSHLGPPIESRLCNSQLCPINGGYTSWSLFSNCSKTCGGGVQVRNRNCTNPSPAYGGVDCTRLGSSKEIKDCNKNPCPINGGFGLWSSFGLCSASCGGGKRRRTRLCDNPLPAHGGKNCSLLGSTVETMSCNTQKCPDIVFLTVVRFLEEKFEPFLYNRESDKFQNFRKKIENNVKQVFGPFSAFDGLDIICEPGISENKLSGIQCKLELQFSSGGYEGIIDLQDALYKKGMLGIMPVETSYLISSDVPTDYKGLNVQVYNASAQSLNVTWTVSDKREKEDVQGYRLIYTDEMNNKHSKIVQGRDKNHAEIKHLKIYHYYCVRLLPFNARGDGLATNPVCAYTDYKVPGDFPKNLSALEQPNNDSLIMITWDHIDKDLIYGNLLGYVLRYYKVRATQNVTIVYKQKILSPTTDEYLFQAFGKFSLYRVQIAAFNEKGLGNWSEVLEFYTAQDVPSKAPRIDTAFNTSSTSLYVTWHSIPYEHHNGKLLGYRVFYKDVAIANDNHYDNITISPDLDEATIMGLKKHTTYVVQVAGFNKKGESAPSKRVLVSTNEDAPSQPPSNVTVANTSSTSLLVQWSPVPKHERNGEILGYKIVYKRSGTNQTVVTKCCIPDTTAADLESLEKFTRYDVQILAFTTIGDGPLSNVVTARTAQDIPSKPPTILKLHNTSSTSLKVTWQPIPARYVHGILLGYRLLYRSGNDTKGKYTHIEVGPSKNEVYIKGLYKYMNYKIRLLGFTKVGHGTVSDEVIVRTDQDVPSWPPEQVRAANKTSPTKIHVSWQPISNQYYIHGILLGYKVLYREMENPDELINGKAEVISLPPNTHSVTITNLTSYTIYSIEVLAFTSKGDGVTSKPLFIETCNCHRRMYSNWWSNPPYSNKNVSGIFISLLEMLTKTCCGECAEHEKSEIDFDNFNKRELALKRNENHVREDIEDNSEVSFPITGRYGQTGYNDHAFVPLVESGGTVFMTITDEPGMMASMVVMQVFKLWPMCMAVFVSAFFAGIAMWSLDTLFNSNEFPRSPFRGVLEGMWWAFITMTTLGYGDRIPKAFHSKTFGIVWITCGLVIVALFMSLITASLTSNVMGSEKMVYGSKVAALSNSSEFRLGIRLNGRLDQDVKYDDLRDVYKALKRRQVDGILLDAFSAGSRKDLFGDDELRITKIISHSSVHGVVLAGNAKRLQSCYRSFLKEERVRVFGVITRHVEPVEASSVTSSEMTADLFDSESYVFRQALTWTCIIFGVFAAIFLVYEFFTRKKRNPNPLKYDFSDKTSLVPLIYLHGDPFLNYTATKGIMLSVVKEFHASCRATSLKLRQKHARELKQLYKMKTQDLMPDQHTKSSDKKNLFDEARKALWRIVAGIFPENSAENATAV